MIDNAVEDVVYKLITDLCRRVVSTALCIISLNARNIYRKLAASFAEHTPEALVGSISFILCHVIVHRRPPTSDICKCS
jgi:hypothetical protein